MATTTENGVLMHGEELELENGCGCFQRLWISNDDERRKLLSGRRKHKELWLVTQLTKLKHVSEVVAGPKWKNLIRKIGAYLTNKKKKKDFQYDSFNYTLNFDDGMHGHDEDGAALGFSSRFAPPANDKALASM
ncbi:uncharacterized protein LOC141595791 [Silene latifolia]|uniref:uncharacterized protein LOC141595791 n=1 Tax=Silene latifolia TaxID=37657 RepID=UPI003D7881A7